MIEKEVEKYAEIFRKKLAALRLEKGWSYNKIARRLNCDHTTIFYLEKGRTRPSFLMLIKLALLFDCSIDYLCGFNNSTKKK